jgi:hypothetical protein
MLNKLFHKISGWPFAGRQKRVMQTRSGLSKEEFTHMFSVREISPEIAGRVWDAVIDWCDIDGFTPHPDDDLGWLYGLGEEDLDEDIILALLEHFDCYIPTHDEMVSEGVTTRTVGEVVTFIDRMQKRKRRVESPKSVGSQ